MSSLKVLVSGDVEGNFKQLFDRVNQVNKKAGPFHLLLVVGNFFGPDHDPELTIPPAPIPTYILGPTNTAQLPYYFNLNGCEIAENITYLGRQGVYNEATGLKIAYLSGLQHDGPSSTKKDFQFNYEDIKSLHVRLENESGFKGVDILLTSQWPAGIDNLTSTKPDEPVTHASTLVASLAHRIRPRYHFAGLEGLNYERVPYRNHEVLAEAAQHCSRFISLGKVGNSKKRKWIYAFNIAPMKTMSKEELLQEPPSITANPFTGTSTLKQAQSGGQDPSSNKVTASSNQFFYDTSYTGERTNNYRGGRGKRNFQNDGRGGGRGGAHPPKRHQQGPPSACWFCLASPEVEKHLVISIGDSAYLTIAKGGLTEDHLLILPIGHFQCLIECPPEVVEEIDKFKRALRKYFDSLGKVVIFYERNFKSPHLQIQVVPIPKEINVGLKITCLDYAESEGIEMQEFPANAELFQMTRPGFPYFFMELPDGTKLFSSIKKNFPIQFGRELLASDPILNCSDKIDWKQCKMSKEEETTCTQRIRSTYKAFDFTLE